MLKDLFGFDYLKSLREVGPENTSKTIRAFKSLKSLKEEVTLT